MAVDLSALSSMLGNIGKPMGSPLNMRGAAQDYMATLGAIQYPTAQKQIQQGLQTQNPQQMMQGLSLYEPKAAVDFWTEMERNKEAREAQKRRDDSIRAENAYGKTLSYMNQLTQQYTQQLSTGRTADAQATKDEWMAKKPTLDAQWKALNAINPSLYPIEVPPPPKTLEEGLDQTEETTPSGDTLTPPEAPKGPAVNQDTLEAIVKDGVISATEESQLARDSGTQSPKDFKNQFPTAIEEALSAIEGNAVAFVMKNAKKYSGTKGRQELANVLETQLGLSTSSPAYRKAMEAQASESEIVSKETMSDLQRQQKMQELANGSAAEQKALGFYNLAVTASEDIKPISQEEVALMAASGSTVAKMLQAWNRTNLSPAGNAAMVWVDNLLRSESGAAIAPEESAGFLKNYIPVEGDSPEKIANKAKYRQAKMDAMLIQTGSLKGKAKKLEGTKPTPTPKPKAQSTAPVVTPNPFDEFM